MIDIEYTLKSSLKVLLDNFFSMVFTVQTRYPDMNSDQVFIITFIILQKMQEFTGNSGGPRDTNEDMFARMLWHVKIIFAI